MELKAISFLPVYRELFFLQIYSGSFCLYHQPWGEARVPERLSHLLVGTWGHEIVCPYSNPYEGSEAHPRKVVWSSLRGCVGFQWLPSTPQSPPDWSLCLCSPSVRICSRSNVSNPFAPLSLSKGVGHSQNACIKSGHHFFKYKTSQYPGCKEHARC